jgi:hypothetical protein
MRQAASALDGAALGLSAICLAHCLALPLLAAALPLFGAWAEAEWVHILLVLMAAPLVVFALIRPGHGLTPSAALTTLGLAGLALLAFGAFGPSAYERVSTVSGSVLLAAAHLLNWRRRLLRTSGTAPCAAD